MDTYNENTYNTSVNSAVAPLAREKEGKTSWYSVLKENPEAMAKFKEYTKQRYEERKKVIKEKAELGILEIKPKQVKPYKPIDPERKKRYNDKYYTTHRDTLIDNQVKRYFEVIKTSPEKLENERARIRLYYQRMYAIPEERERKNQYTRDYKRKRRELLRQNKLNTDSNTSTTHEDSEEAKPAGEMSKL